MQEHELAALVGMTARAQDGQKIGRIEEVLSEEHSQEGTWLRIRTGLLGRHGALAPVSEARVESGDLVLPYDKNTVVQAPTLDGGWPPSFDDAQSLHQYYATTWMAGQAGRGGTSHVAGAAYTRPDPADGIADPASVSARTGAREGSDALGRPQVTDGPKRYDELIEPRDQADRRDARGERDE
ncbi:MAG: PRC-barrel domain-containing protein [Oryzihumus sp.]